MVSMPSPAAIMLAGPKRTNAREGVPCPAVGRSTGALSRPDGSTRCGAPMQASQIGDGGDRTGQISVGASGLETMVAAWMESQAGDAMEVSDAASPQVSLHNRAGNRFRHREQTPCRFRRAGRRWRRMRSIVRLRLGSRQAQEASCLLSDIVKIDQGATFSDYVEQIAVFAGCRVGPFACRATARAFRFQADEHRSAGRVLDVLTLADDLYDATSCVGEIVTAHRLGLAREAMYQFCRIARHMSRRRPIGSRTTG